MTRIVLACSMLAGLVASASPASDPVTTDPPPDAKFPAAMGEIAIDSQGSRLNGLVYVAAGRGPHPTVLLLHGFPGNEKNLDLAQAMRRAGFNVVFFHYRGSWGSGGDFSFSGSLQDVAAVLEYLRDEEAATRFRVDPRRLSLVGHSMGGFMALVASARDTSVRCTASIAGANLGLLGAAARSSPRAAEAAAAALQGGTGPLRGTSGEALRDEILANSRSFDLVTHAVAFAERPLLLVGASRDSVVPMEHHHKPLVAALAAAGAGLREEVLATDHAFSDHRIGLARVLVGWLAGACR